MASRARRFTTLFFAVALIGTGFTLVTAQPALAHGYCDYDWWDPLGSGGSWIANYYDYSTTKVHGDVTFHCRDGEQHASIEVAMRVFRCARRSSIECDGPWNQIKQTINTCTTAKTCTTTANVNCLNTDSLVWVKGWWRVKNASGVIVHTNPSYTNYDWSHNNMANFDWIDCA